MSDKTDSLGRARRVTQGGAGPKHLPDKVNAIKAGTFDKSPPDDLQEEASKWWTWAVATLETMGILDAADTAHIKLCAETFQDYQDARSDFYGNRILMDDKGNQKRNPAFTTMEKARTTLRSFYSDLGLTPSARAKFGGGEDEADPWEALVKKQAMGN